MNMIQDMTHRMSNKNSVWIPAMRARMVLAGLVLLLSGGNAAAQESGGSGDSPSGGDTPTTPTTTGVVVNGSVYGGGNLADVGGTVVVNIKAGTVAKDVYGGGALANTNTNNWDPTVVTYEPVSVAEGADVTGLYEESGGSYTVTNDETASGGKTYYQQIIGTWASGMVDATGKTTYFTTVNLLGGTISGDAYGGGLGRLPESVHYTQEEADAYNREHGLSSGDSGYKTTADWQPEVKATVYGDISVNLGSSAAETSATAFNINYYDDNTGTNLDESTLVNSGRVFGGNNLNGSPQGNVTVTVYKTVKGNTDKTASDKLKSTNDGDHHYQVAAVYGGGNLSNYEPTTTGKKAHVIINGCNVASILTVYGGGNAAAVPETDVDIYGSYEIGAVFGGGNGKDPYTLDNGTTWTTNPGANVNGNANTMLYGGLIHEAFGGSNEKGRITGNVAINTDPDESECDLDVGTIYGAGKNADIDGDLIVTLGCMPADKKTDAVYGGAENANVKGKVELTITSGNFGKVFGGNNTSGAIFGGITLNIMESGCSPINIDELYLGGFKAAYSVYGYYVKTEDTDGKGLPTETAILTDNQKLIFMPRTSASDTHKPVKSYSFNENTQEWEWTVYSGGEGDPYPDAYPDPVLNIVSATSIGKVFGGGLGSEAVIYGNPTVNINQAYPLKWAGYSGGVTTYQQKEDKIFGEIGGGYDEGTNHVEGGIFGGGNEAAVYGNTTVNIGTKTTVDWKVLVLDGNQKPVLDANGNFLTQTITDETYKAVIGANIVGNVYGGGNQADVKGNTYVNICAETGDEILDDDSQPTGRYNYTAVDEGDEKVTIAGNVFGAGKGVESDYTAAMVRGNSNVNMANGSVLSNIYGGGELSSVGDFTYNDAADVLYVITGCEANTGTSTVNIMGGSVGTNSDYTYDEDDIMTTTAHGNVFAGSKGELKKANGDYLTDWLKFARVKETVLTVSGVNTRIMSNIYGGGELGLVGYKDNNTLVGSTTVTVSDGTIGTEIKDDDSKTQYTIGSVFGGGYGSNVETVSQETDIHAPKLYAGRIYGSTSVEMTGGAVKASVYGGGQLASVGATGVGGNAVVAVSGGTVGIDKDRARDKQFGGATMGNVYGGGSGDRTIVRAGQIFGNTTVTISGTPIIYHNIYGGGAYGSVGDFNYTTTEEDEDYEGIAKVNGIKDNPNNNEYPLLTPGTGTTSVTVTGGTIGVDGNENGMVFGSSRGDVGTNRDKWQAWVYETNVVIGEEGEEDGPDIMGSVYGSGENGHVYTDTEVEVHSGTIGIYDPNDVEKDEDGKVTKDYNTTRGNVYGGGCGEDTYPSNTTVTDIAGNSMAGKYEPSAGIVYGTTKVTMTGGIVKHNVYGAGALGSVGMQTTTTNGDVEISSGGTTTIEISGGIVGVNGDGNGNVFGAARGDSISTQPGIALVKMTNVTISGTNTLIKGNVYGGGQAGDVGTYHTVTEAEVEAGADALTKGNNNYLANSGLCTVLITGGKIGTLDDENNITAGNVFGAGKGAGNTYTCQKAMVRETSVTISNGEIYGDVYGGGEVGRVEQDATVTIGSGTGDGPFAPIIHGNVFGAGAGLETHGYSALVRGNSTVTIEGKAKVRKNVYGGGKAATVGKYWVSVVSEDPDEGNRPPAGFPPGMPYATRAGGLCTVTVRGDATIGPESGDASEEGTEGQVFGAGKGITPHYYGSGVDSYESTAQMPKRMMAYNQTSYPSTTEHTSWDYTDDTHQYVWEYLDTRAKYLQFLESLALASNTLVTIGGSSGSTAVKASVFGGSESGFVQDHTSVTVNSSAVIGTTTTTTYGNVFGGGKGLETFAEAGRVRGNTSVAFNGGRAYGNVYGGGKLGDVGTIDKTDIKNYKWIDRDGAYNNTGVCTVTVSGGNVGPDNNSNIEKGNVFGAGKGVGDTFWCEKAMVYDTKVSIENGTVHGNVYGGGEVGRVENDTEVTVGRKSTDAGGTGTGTPDIKGSVFGAGKGLETHGYSALVRGNTTVTVDGAANAIVENSVYGGGEIASVGRYGLDANEMPEVLVFGGICTVTVQGSATIGSTTGNVFGAGKGVVPHFDNDNDNKAKRSRRMTLYTNNTSFPADAMIPASGGTPTGTTPIWGSTWEYTDATHTYVWEYFQSEEKYKKYLETLALATHPEVTIDGSAIVNGSVFGGGELGLTKGSVVVNIQGGTIMEDVYGGGSLADSNTTKDVAKRNPDTGKPLPPDETGKYDTQEVHPTTTVNLLGGKIVHDAYGGGLGDATHAPSVNGDVLVELNNNNHGGTAIGSQTGCVVDRIFGCNNLNGTPKKKVQVKVYATQKNGGENLLDKTIGSYDVRAVYGGGNLSPYEPDDALWTDPEDYVANKAKVDAARPEVTIDGCALTSIETVYGGGNAASVPATYVVVERCYEINEVFGGGNGYDNYSKKEGENIVWYKNPGANVGYYTYATYPKDEGHGTGVDEAHAYEAVETAEYSEYGATPDEIEEHKANRLAAYDIQYGSGIATLVVKGGTIHTTYGGSNSKGNVRKLLSSTLSAMYADCTMNIGQSYGGGKNAYSDADSDVKAECAKGLRELFGGSKNADFNGNVNMLITNGSSLERVFGGNNTSGAVRGSITITLEEGGCEPIIIKDLYLGGFLAPYSVYGYESEKEEVKDKDGNVIVDDNGDPILQLKLKTSGQRLYQDPRIYIISASQIENVYGGGYQAKLVGNPHINVNMTRGKVEVTRNVSGGTDTYTDINGISYATDITEEDGQYYAYLPIGTIGNIYGGGNMADIVGDTHVEIGTGKWHNGDDVLETEDVDGNKWTYNTTTKKWTKSTYDEATQTWIETSQADAPAPGRYAAKITGNVYGGGNQADVTGNTYVDICAYEDDDINTADVIEYKGVALNDSGQESVTIGGNVFGGGKGKADSFRCPKAMVGVENTNNGDIDITTEVTSDGTSKGTRVSIGNGTVEGSVYGGGQIGRVEWNTVVTIGLPVESGKSKPVIGQYVFGAGKGVEQYGYAALVRGNTFVTIQADAKVGHSVYGGGEIASVGKYNVVGGVPTSLANQGSGYCNVTVKGNAEIGPDDMQMYHADSDGNIPADDKPDDWGHVFGAGKGILPYEDKDHFECQDPTHQDSEGHGLKHPGSMKPGADPIDPADDVWICYEGNEAGYLEFVETQALATQTEVIIGGNAFVKGSVYGGSENGHVQHGTHVTIEGDCQIGAGFDPLTKKSKAKYTGWPTETENISDSWAECAHWDYDPSSGASYDKYAIYERDGKSYYYDSNITTYHNDDDGKDYADEAYTLPIYAEGGAKIAKDGHTYYGNVFGGGSGSIPYAPGKWHRAAGSVGGNTVVDITGGHILTSVYGGNEQTDVGTYKKDANGNITTTPEDEDEEKGLPGGKCTINMMGGTIGVPRTEADAKAHPVTCYLFGAGKGDQRIFFNTWTNVINTEVNISGEARIYGSTFGGGEDGHIINNAVTNIGGTMTIGGKNYTPTNKLIIGTTGTSYVDGNVFGGGRGFSGDAQTAGTVGGNIEVNIYNGKMLGSIYGGGRLASVGTQFTSPTDPNYGNFLEDGNGKSYGHVIVNISGGTIGRDFVKDDAGNLPAGAEHSGNVFGGSMGRLTLLNGDINPIWPKMAQVKTSAVNVYGTAVIKRNVFGGGELGTVRDNASVVIGGYLNPRVSDGCKSDFIFNPSKSDSTITVSASANAPIVYRDVYGGGYGSQDFETKTKITVKMPKDGVTNPTSASDYMDVSYVFTPMVFAGCVGQHTFVNIAGGMVRKSVYGGGEMASVGILDCRVDENGNYINVHSHLEGDDGFALSWPYHFENAPGYFGATHVKVTGGRIGVADGDDDINTDNGDVYGGGKGIAGDYKNYVFCANVGSTDVTIKYPEENNATPQTYMSNETIECIAGAVYGGAENGHVMGDVNLTIENGLIGHSVYGGGSGKGTFTKWLTKIPEDRRTVVTSGGSGTPPETNESGEYKAECYSITAGKVFGNITLEMKGGYVVRNVYGGGNMGSVGKGNYSGGADDYSKAGYGETLTGNLWDGGSQFSQAFLGSGKCTVKITGGTVGYIGYDANDPLKYVYPRDYNTGLPYGNVFGGCRGESAPNILEHPRYLYCPEFFLGYVNETDVTIGKSDGSGPTILGSVYGGGMDGHVRRDTKVTIYGGEIGSEYTPEECAKIGTSDLNNIMWLHRGNVYGAGSGIGKYKYDFNYDGDYEDEVDYTTPGDRPRTTRLKECDYSTSAGSVTRFTKVVVNGGKIHHNVYGGGSLSSIGGPKIPPITDDPIRRDDSAPTTQGIQSLNEVIISSGSTTIIGDATSYDYDANNNLVHVYGGHVFGASRGDETLSNPTSFASSAWTDVKVQGGTIYGDVYGGGEVGTVRQGTEVQLTGGVIGSVKGGEVVGGDVFGGGKGSVGEYDVAADIGGDVLVELNKGLAKTDPGCVVDRIFGANNVNGTPKGHVTVHVYATQNRNQTAYPKIEDKKEVTSPEPPASDFDMTGVFGGGKSSDYVPAESDTKQSTEVIIEGCSLTSIYEVYGGGYGASTPGTNVLINGTKIIDKVFGGGYGAGEHEIITDPNYNPGANVGILSDGSTPYGLHLNDETKIAIVQLKAGKVNSVFGGSNSKGDIRNGASITTLTSEEAETQTDDPCEILEVGELYGGGNEAPMEEGGAEIVLRCMPDSWIGEVYAGARKADVGNDVSLTITSGKFEHVFGGNKSGGQIDGYVEVNIEECPTCNTPVIIGELYGGGNEAEYTYSHLDTNPDYPSPRVNVRAFTSIGTIYGGGKGRDAVVNGNPTVYVSVGMVDGGGQDYVGGSTPNTNVRLYPHEKGKIGVIGDVFGGGNAAVVNGNTNVFIGTEKFVKLDRIVAGETDVSNYYIRTGTSSNYQYTEVRETPTPAVAGVKYYQRKPNGTYEEVSVSAGADVNGYYTCSGEGTEAVYTPVCVAQPNTVYCVPVVGADIQGNVYGGGNAAEVTGNTNVVVGKKKTE